MQKFYVLVVRTALVLLLTSIFCIMTNALLSQTSFGMIAFMWRPSWIALSFSVSVLLIMLQHEDEGKLAGYQTEKKEN